MKVSVDALNSVEAASAKTFVLRSGMKDVTEEDLYFREFADAAVRALEKRGYRRVDDPAVADMVVGLIYGSGDPVTTTTVVKVPIFGVKGGGTMGFTGTAWGQGGNMVPVSGEVQVPTRIGVVGSVEHRRDRTTFRSFVVLYAVDLRKLRAAKVASRIWQVMGALREESDDLRVMFPALLVGIGDFVGGNTRRRIEVEIEREGGSYHRVYGSHCGRRIPDDECDRIKERCHLPSPGMDWEMHIHFCRKAGKI